MEVFRAYIDVFSPKMDLIASRCLPKLIPFTSFYDASSLPAGFDVKFFFDRARKI